MQPISSILTGYGSEVEDTRKAAVSEWNKTNEEMHSSLAASAAEVLEGDRQKAYVRSGKFIDEELVLVLSFSIWLK